MELLKLEGVRPMSLKAKIAGGSQMFQFGSSDTIRIGPRNIEAVKKELQRLSIPLIAEDEADQVGRTIEFNPSTSMLSDSNRKQGNERNLRKRYEKATE